MHEYAHDKDDEAVANADYDFWEDLIDKDVAYH